MAYYVALNREESNVNLDLSSDDKPVLGTRPLSVKVFEFVDWWVVERGDRECFLHRAFHQPARQCEGLGNELCRRRLATDFTHDGYLDDGEYLCSTIFCWHAPRR